MLLLFAADILFVYGVAGLLLLPFVNLRPRVVVTWGAGIMTAYFLATLALAVFSSVPEEPGGDSFQAAFNAFFAERTDATVAAYTAGDLVAQLTARAWEALIIQGAQLFELPWVLALFLFGYAIGESRLLTEPASAQQSLRRVAIVALPIGLALNLPIGFEGSLGAVPAGPPSEEHFLLVMGLPIARTLGPPLLALGYLAGLALLSTHHRAALVLRPLSAAGRMALSGYLTQSLVCTALFVWLGWYDRLSTTGSLAVVLGVWVIVLAGCSAWLAVFDRGPVEAVWRRLTYGSPG